MSGDEWVALALQRAQDAVSTLSYSVHAAGSTRSSLRHAYDQLRAASEHLLDAGFELGVGDIR